LSVREDMDLSVIIINWNSKNFLEDCLASLQRSAQDVVHEVLVVDNASYDGSEQLLATEFPRVKYIQSERNLGFAGANNIAARRAKGDLLLFLNPDTVMEGDAIRQLVDALRRLPGAGIAAPRLLNTDRTLQTSCIQSFPTVLNQALDCDWLRRWFPQSSWWGNAALFNGSAEPVAVEAVSGACLMIKRELFERLKGFDDRYFMYSEDIDLAFKCGQAGFKCYHVPAAIIIHHGGGSSQNASGAFSNVMIRESVYRFMRQHRGRLRAQCFRVVIGISALVRLPLAASLCCFRQGAGGRARARVSKWVSVIRWSLGMESWAARQ